uniref:Uncharacterized protein n=1 Tax=Chromera velia CCMP2878 TaxID=1169474 RepID=A0A0G4F6K8_9ALVE|eukprot:Cvel_15394.t1-p1 / transcript=Cvel_15394.t1 / gene=Cvel_15394 / organism=Chromera_velia_CCMP2878 / gene_product=hypothetical protein / transcript_product=hypothetical protein / location=Cvel_scaffold1136:43889-45666(-) / protein_length=136 / sequence_SO=supercontig / SO=protein_coding / is_pseudo=false
MEIARTKYRPTEKSGNYTLYCAQGISSRMQSSIAGLPMRLVELGRWAVLDLGSKAESHIVSGGNAEFRVLRVGGEAVLHPLSMLCQGAIRERAHLLPNSRPLKGLALPAASVSVGNPSLQGVRKDFESVSGPLDAV